MKSPAEIIQSAFQEGRKALFEHEARELARSVGIIVPKFEVVDPRDEPRLLSAAEKLGFPIAVKAVSADIMHKTEAGAVLLDIKNKMQLAIAAKQIMSNIAERVPNATIRYLLVEKMMPSGPELLIGGLRDEQFGPAIAFGLGGIWTEALKDAVFGILPLARNEMLAMISQTRAAAFFQGFRGTPPLDQDAVLSIMSAVSTLMTNHREIGEIDLNPVRVYARSAAAIDVRILLRR